MLRAVPADPDRGGQVAIPLGPARYLLTVRDVAEADLRAALADAEFRLRPPERLFVRAEHFTRLEGEMAPGFELGIEDPDAFGDVLVVTGRPTVSPARDWYAEYTVEIPRAGLWSIWGRVRYPSGGDQSFGFVVPGEQVTLAYGDGQILGNCGVGVQHVALDGPRNRLDRRPARPATDPQAARRSVHVPHLRPRRTGNPRPTIPGSI
jgi:hypothetical protein